MDFSKILDFVTPQGPKDIAKNLQARITDLIGQNEDLYSESENLKKRNQELEDQIRILKGEKPIPKFKDSKDVTSDENKDEKKDKKKTPGAPRRKKVNLSIDETIDLKVAREKLPVGAIHKGYRQITIQEILFERHNICFNIERFIDPVAGKLIEAEQECIFRHFGPAISDIMEKHLFQTMRDNLIIFSKIMGLVGFMN